MLVTRINPDWTWPRAKNVVIDVTDVTDVTSYGYSISYEATVKATTPHEKPALHRSLMRTFSRYLEDGDKESLIKEWYQRHGPLTKEGTVESFLEEASIAWWVVNVIDRFGGIGAYSNEDAIQPDKVRLFAADSLYLEVPDHLGKNATENLPYSVLLNQVITHINNYLDGNASLINESPWNMGRDRYGKKDPSFADDTTTHRITTVVQPRNLSGFIWLRIQHQLEETPKIDFYPCNNFEDCDQELPRMNDVSRRKWCSNTCRMSKKNEREQDNNGKG